MYRYFSLRLNLVLVLLSLLILFVISAAPHAAFASYSSALRRYPYLTDVVDRYATINWGTNRSESTGAVRYGKVGSEACTAHYVPATRTAISVNGVLEYQWRAMLTLAPGTQYCYRVYLGTSPSGEIDLLGSDAAPKFRTQVPSGANQAYSFAVIGDWGMVDSTGSNTYQANLMSLIASSGARFVVTTGDNGYPDGNQKNLGDLIQTGLNISAVFGPAFWKVPGPIMPIFPAIGNHGYNSSDTNHPHLLTWPQLQAVNLSGGRYVKETYCCLDGTTSQVYPSAWYAFDAGPARFYVLHAAWDGSNIGTASEYKVDYDYHWASGSAQLAWLKADLAAHPSVLKFAFLHYPIYSDDPTEPTDTYLLGAGSLEGLLKQNGVDLAFTGHAHIYERNLASSSGIPNYVTGGGGATPNSLGTCTSLDAYAIKFTSTGKGCGSAPAPTSAAQVYHYLLVTVNGYNVTVTPINSLGNSFDVMNYSFANGAETTPPSTPTGLQATVASGTRINLSWTASTDNVGVRGYDIYRNGSLIATVDQNTLTFADTGLSVATNYSYRVDAFDGSAKHSAQSAAASATTQGVASYTFNPVADAYVRSDMPSTNYGLLTTLTIDNSPTYRSYLRFNIGDLSGNVTSATLRVYTSSSSTTGFSVHRLLNPAWEEASLNYSNAPDAGAVIGTSGSFTSGKYISVDVSSFVTGEGVYDFVLTTSSSSAISFSSRDASGNNPQLVIKTSASPATNTPTATTVNVTNTTTPTPTVTASKTPAFTATATPTATATSNVTSTPTSTRTPTKTPTPTQAVTFTPTSTSQQHTPVFTDGFESGNLSAWTTTAGLTVESTIVHGGTFAAQANTTNGGTYAKKLLPTTYSNGYARIYFNLVSYSSQVNLLRYRTAADASMTYLFVNTAGKLGLRNDIGAVTFTSATSVTSGWHALEFHVTSNGASSTTEVWLDGVKVNDLSVTMDLGTNLIGKIQIGEVITGRTYNVIFDDVVFDNQPIGQ